MTQETPPETTLRMPCGGRKRAVASETEATASAKTVVGGPFAASATKPVRFANRRQGTDGSAMSPFDPADGWKETGNISERAFSA
ncbi:MAG: hypothetical protein D6725_03530 [Planctomycetota bacterium]|nr:MAG: hypothetical protein D6725_03530 [Planctomycetota bacterium]